MPTFVMLTNLSAEGVQTLKNNPSRVSEVNKEVEQLGVTVKDQWATLGQDDFITIVQAPDDQTMAKVSVELGSRGTMCSQTRAAIPAEDFAKSLWPPQLDWHEGPRRRRRGARARHRA